MENFQSPSPSSKEANNVPLQLVHDAQAKTHHVLSILDNDVPLANASGDSDHLSRARKFYETAVKEAQAITNPELEAARLLYSQVNEELRKTSPASKRENLITEKNELFQVIHARDAALGNMALWNLRQGKTGEATTEILRALGLNETEAAGLSALTADDIKKIAAKVDPESFLLNDKFFNSTLTGIKQNGIDLPESLLHLGDSIRAAQAAVARESAAPQSGSSGEQIPQITSTNSPGETKGDNATVPAKSSDAPQENTRPVDDPRLAQSPEQLRTMISQAISLSKEQPPKLQETKAAFEKVFFNLENSQWNNNLVKRLSDQVDLLERGRKADGTPLSSAERTELHKDNQSVIDNINNTASLRLLYCEYLSGKQIDALGKNAMADDAQNVSDGKLNQNKAMQESLQRAIADADLIPASLLRREEQNLLATQKLTPDRNEQAVVSAGLDQIKGTKDIPSAGDFAVNLRVRAASLYLHQGVVLEGGELHVRKPVEAGKVDELFKPDLAVQLLADADKRYKEVHGAGADNNEVKELASIASQLTGDHLKKAEASADWNWKSIMTDAGALVGTLVVDAIAARFHFRASPATLNSIRLGLSSAAAFGVRRLGMGGDESIGESLIHTAGVVGAVKIGRFTSSSASNSLLKNADAPALMSRFAGSSEATVKDLGTRLLGTSEKWQAARFLESPYAGRSISSLSADELKSFASFKGENGIRALTAVEKTYTPSFKAVQGLESQGIGTVAELRGAFAEKYTARQFQKVFPGLRKVAPETTLSEAQLAKNDIFGKVGGKGMKALEGLNPAITSQIERTPFFSSLGEKTLDMAFRNRMWGFTLNRTKDIAEYSPAGLRALASRSENLSNYSGYMLGLTAFNSSVGVYDRLSRAPRLGEQPYTFGEALSEANFGERKPSVSNVGTALGEGLFFAPGLKQLSSIGLTGKYFSPAFHAVQNLSVPLVINSDNPFREKQKQFVAIQYLRDSAESPLRDADTESQPQTQREAAPTSDENNPLGFTTAPLR